MASSMPVTGQEEASVSAGSSSSLDSWAKPRVSEAVAATPGSCSMSRASTGLVGSDSTHRSQPALWSAARAGASAMNALLSTDMNVSMKVIRANMARSMAVRTRRANG
jgi:hypothetical protein